MINKECNAGDPLETLGGLYRGPPTTRMVMQYIISMFQFYVVSAWVHDRQNMNRMHSTLLPLAGIHTSQGDWMQFSVMPRTNASTYILRSNDLWLLLNCLISSDHPHYSFNNPLNETPNSTRVSCNLNQICVFRGMYVSSPVRLKFRSISANITWLWPRVRGHQ